MDLYVVANPESINISPFTPRTTYTEIGASPAFSVRYIIYPTLTLFEV